MKRLLLLAVSLGVFCASQAQTTITVTIPENVATREWVETYVHKKIDSLKATIPQIPVLQPCKLGPAIIDIITASKDYLTVKFDGIDVFGIDWSITKEGWPIRTGKLEPKTNTVKFAYAELPKGEYTLWFSGNTCSGTGRKEFKIK